MLRGRDIQRYQVKWDGLWLIDTHNGYEEIPPININNYKAIKRHLDKFYPNLKRRQDKGITLYNLRNCAYYEEFEKEKLVWIELVENGRFAYDRSGIYCEATCFIMTGECIKYLTALLNSKLIRWFFSKIAPTSGMGTLRWKKAYVNTIPVPRISAKEQKPLIHLVNKILSAKATDSGADTSGLEIRIDCFVYKLYCLKPEEISFIESTQG